MNERKKEELKNEHPKIENYLDCSHRRLLLLFYLLLLTNLKPNQSAIHSFGQSINIELD